MFLLIFDFAVAAGATGVVHQRWRVFRVFINVTKSEFNSLDSSATMSLLVRNVAHTHSISWININNFKPILQPEIWHIVLLHAFRTNCARQHYDDILRTEHRLGASLPLSLSCNGVMPSRTPSIRMEYTAVTLDGCKRDREGDRERGGFGAQKNTHIFRRKPAMRKSTGYFGTRLCCVRRRRGWVGSIRAGLSGTTCKIYMSELI